MKVALVSPITKTADLPLKAVPPVAAKNLAPRTDCDLNIVETARRMASLGHEVTVFVADAFVPQERCPPEEGLRIEYLPTRLKAAFAPAVWPLTPALADRIRRDGYDAVVTTELFQPATLLSWLSCKGLGTDHFVWQELDTLWRGPAGLVQHNYYRSAGKKLARDAKRIMTRSISARLHLEAEGIPTEKISPIVVHSGVDTSRFRPLDKAEARARLQLEGCDELILSVGRLHPNKGMDRLISAMPELLKERRGAMLVIKGSGPQEAELRELVVRLGMEGKVRLMTDYMAAEELPWLFSAADVLAVASRIDLFPFTAIESIACGTPIATTFGRGLRTDIVDKGAGILLPEGQAELAEGLSEALEDGEALRSMGAKGRRLAEQEFDFGVGARRMVEQFGG